MNNRPTNSMWMTGLFLAAIMSGHAPALGQQRETSVTPDAGLAALVNSANDVVLVHILTDSCQIPKVEPAPTTKCEGLILLSWKGLKDSDSIAFSIASGHLRNQFGHFRPADVTFCRCAMPRIGKGAPLGSGP